jgi:tRNA splicing ligase
MELLWKMIVSATNAKRMKYLRDSMMYNSVVIADKNNHIDNHRIKMCDRYTNLEVWFLCWDIPKYSDTIKFNEYHETLCDRIIKRGSNHPTLTPMTNNYSDIIFKFLRQRSPSINILHTNSHQANILLMDDIETTIESIKMQLPLSSWIMRENTTKKSINEQVPLSNIPLVTYIRLEIVQMISLTEYINNCPELSVILNKHHITLLYGSNFIIQNYWIDVENREYLIELDSVCYDTNIMAITLKNFHLPCINDVPHITIAMRPGVKPFTSNIMLAKEHTKIPLHNMYVTACGPIST